MPGVLKGLICAFACIQVYANEPVVQIFFPISNSFVVTIFAHVICDGQHYEQRIRAQLKFENALWGHTSFCRRIRLLDGMALTRKQCNTAQAEIRRIELAVVNASADPALCTAYEPDESHARAQFYNIWSDEHGWHIKPQHTCPEIYTFLSCPANPS